MSEIADLTYNIEAFSQIMEMLWKRLNDHGKNWRHVYKSLVLLEYLIKTGSERVSSSLIPSTYHIYIYIYIIYMIYIGYIIYIQVLSGLFPIRYLLLIPVLTKILPFNRWLSSVKRIYLQFKLSKTSSTSRIIKIKGSM